MQYLVVIEQGDQGFGAYVPDLPGCIAAGDSQDEVLELIQEAIEFHIEGLQEQGAQGIWIRARGVFGHETNFQPLLARKLNRLAGRADEFLEIPFFHVTTDRAAS